MESTELLNEIKKELELLERKNYDKRSFQSGYLLGYVKALQLQRADEYKQRSDMEREIWEIVKALDEKKLTAIEAHKKLCGLYIVSGSSLLNQCLKEQEEIISSPIRFNVLQIGEEAETRT